MKSTTKLLSAAFAIAAIAATTLPTAQPVAAGAPADLEAKILATHRASGSVMVEARIKNIGDTKSTATIMHKNCGYAPPSNVNSILLEWTAVDVLHPSVPALNPGQSSPDTNFNCPVINGQGPVAVRIVAAATQGESNMANNKASAWVYKLD